MGRTPIRLILHLAALSLLPTLCLAQKKWDGGAGDGQWSSAANWYPDGLPSATEDVWLDNSLLPTAYTVTLPSGNGGITIPSLQILPGAGMQITLSVPSVNTASPALNLTGTGECLVLGDGAVFRNASGATAGESLALQGAMAIRNGGRYVHQTARANATIINHLSPSPGTEKGIFEFDVPGTSGYTVSLTGNTFGSLVFSAVAAGGSKSYSGSGTSMLQVGGDLVVNVGAQLTSTLTADIRVGATLRIDGTLNLQPVTAGTVNRSLVFTGSACRLAGTGPVGLGAHFRNLEVSASSSLTLDRDILLGSPGQALVVHAGGMLVTGLAIVNGAGGFIAEEGSILSVGHPDGITTGGSGNIRTAIRDLRGPVTYLFEGNGPQQTGNGLPASVSALGVNKASGDLTLTAPTETRELRLLKGNLVTGNALLTLAEGTIVSPADNYGRMNEGWESSFVSGPLACRLRSAGDQPFPVGINGIFAPVILHKIGSSMVTYTAAYHDQGYPPVPPAGTPVFDHVSTLEYWSLNSSEPSLTDDAGISLSWRAGSRVGTSSTERSSLRIAGLADHGSGWQWVMEGTAAIADGNAAAGWIHSQSAVPDFNVFTFASLDAGNILPLRNGRLDCIAGVTGNELTWADGGSGSNRGVVVEKSRDGLHFQAMPAVPAGRSWYQDPSPEEGWNLYRLVMRDALDSIRYSNTCRIYSAPNTEAKVYPVPARESLHLLLDIPCTGCTCRIMHLNGQVAREMGLPDGKEYDISLDRLPAGMYQLVVTGRSRSFLKRFIKL
jgi:hypothetical protein